MGHGSVLKRYKIFIHSQLSSLTEYPIQKFVKNTAWVAGADEDNLCHQWVLPAHYGLIGGRCSIDRHNGYARRTESPRNVTDCICRRLNGCNHCFGSERNLNSRGSWLTTHDERIKCRLFGTPRLSSNDLSAQF